MGNQRTRRGSPIAAVVICAALLLTGCANTSNDPTMDHTEAHDELDALLVAAQNAMGDEWEISDSGAESCTLPSGQTGARYVLARFGTGLPKDHQQPVIDNIVAALNEATFTPTVSTRTESGVEVTEISYPETGKGVDGLFVQVNISETRSSVLGQTRCVPGDYAEINRDSQTSPPTVTHTSTPTPTP
jgi:hypothetical protein